MTPRTWTLVVLAVVGLSVIGVAGAHQLGAFEHRDTCENLDRPACARAHAQARQAECEAKHGADSARCSTPQCDSDRQTDRRCHDTDRRENDRPQRDDRAQRDQRHDERQRDRPVRD